MKVHAVVTQYGPDAFGAHSPQVPALFAGGPSLDEYVGDSLVNLLREAGAPDDYQLVEHRQEFYTRDGREWFVRFSLDRIPSIGVERQETLALFRELLEVTPDPIDFAAKGPAGEALFVITTLEDRVEWVDSQLDEAGVGTVVVRVGDERLWLANITTSSVPGVEPLPGDMTIRELIEYSAEGRVVEDEPERNFLTEKLGPRFARVPELVAV